MKPSVARRGHRYRALLTVLVFVSLLYVVWFFLPYRLTAVVGKSMTPTLQPGRLLWMDRSYYRKHSPAKGEVIVFKVDGVKYIKRVMALGGETVWLWEYPGTNSAYRDLVSPARLSLMRKAEQEPGAGRLVMIRVPPGQVFAAGDAPTCSIDSRNYGPISFSDLLGRALGVPTNGPDVYLRGVGHGQEMGR
jgi:signal peptidase I